MPVSGKAKRPAVRPSVDYATYGHELGWRQGLQLHITNAPSGSFLVFLLARLAVSAMADEARLAPVNGHRRRCSSLSKVPDADSANEVVSGRNRLPGAISHRKARSRDRAWIGGFQLAGDPAGQDRIHRVAGDCACEAVVAFPALKRAECKALRVGHNPDHHHAAADGTPLFNFVHCRKFEAAVAQWRSMSADQAAGFFTSAQGGLAQRNPPCYLSCSGG